MKVDGKSGLALIVAAMALGILLSAQGEGRPEPIDEIILVDKSISMRGAMGDLKKFAAKDLIGSTLVPGDRLVIEVFYGRVERLFSGTIRSDEDKSEAIRRLESIVADGAFTDIGAALDKAEADLEELGQTERPKYVVLLTDERQEAPPTSRYVSADYRLRHPALTYVKRVDKGAYREIIVGLDVAARVEKAAPAIMRLLDKPPSRSDADLPSPSTGGDSTPSLGTTQPMEKTSPPSPPPSGGFGEGQKEGRGGAAIGGKALPGLLVPILAFLVLAGAAGGALVFQRRRMRDKELHDS